MNKQPCLTEDEFLDLYYGEHPDRESAHRHLEGCPPCAQAWAAFRRDLDHLADPVPDGGERALAGALRVLGAAPEPASLRREPALGPVRERSPGEDKGACPGAGFDPGEILTLAEVALYLRIEVDQARDLLGDLPYLNVGGTIRVRRKALESYLARLEAESLGRRMVEPESPARLRRDLI